MGQATSGKHAMRPCLRARVEMDAYHAAEIWTVAFSRGDRPNLRVLPQKTGNITWQNKNCNIWKKIKSAHIGADDKVVWIGAYRRRLVIG